MFLVLIFIFILGTIIGSFLNVVILRLGTRSLTLTNSKGLTSRSVCFSCNKTLKWYELIPILSFFIQRGHCRTCYSKISWQYPIVEILTGAVFLLIFSYFRNFSYFVETSSGLLITNYQLLITLYYWLIFSILITISIYDFRHKIIPNKLVFWFIVLSLFSVFFELGILNLFGNWKLEIGNFSNHVLTEVILALPLFLIWLLSKGRLMGLGDAKLALGIGFLLGLSKGIVAFVLSFWIGAIFGILLIIASRFIRAYLRSYPRFSASMKSEIPFGPFLIISTFIVFLFDLDLVTLFSWIY